MWSSLWCHTCYGKVLVSGPQLLNLFLTIVVISIFLQPQARPCGRRPLHEGEPQLRLGQCVQGQGLQAVQPAQQGWVVRLILFFWCCFNVFLLYLWWSFWIWLSIIFINWLIYVYTIASLLVLTIFPVCHTNQAISPTTRTITLNSVAARTRRRKLVSVVSVIVLFGFVCWFEVLIYDMQCKFLIELCILLFDKYFRNLLFFPFPFRTRRAALSPLHIRSSAW